MVSAARCGRIRALQAVLAAVILGSLGGEIGCARFSPMRRGGPPAFGTDEVAPSTTSATLKKSTDLYADLVRGPKGAARRTNPTEPVPSNSDTRLLADQTEPVRPAVPTTLPDNPDTKVALQPPVSVAPLAEVAVNAEPAPNVTRPQPVAEEVHRPLPVEVVEAAPRPTLAPSAPASPTGPTLESVLAETRKAVDELSSYQVKMTYQERVSGTLKPVDNAVLSIRREPRAVRIEWQDGPSKGREVIYAVDAKRGGLMHIKMVGPLGMLPRMSIPADSPLALKNSRHPITEAGFDTMVRNMEDAVKNQAELPETADKIRYEGIQTDPALPRPAHKIVREARDGENWVVFIDPETRLPALVQATDTKGELLEHYVFTDPIKNPESLAAANAFDPDARWGPAKGLFQRLARSGDAEAPQTEVR